MKLSQQNQEQETKEWDLDMALSFMQFFFEYNPYSYQRRFIEACLNSKRIAAKFPRQSGKSFMVANYCLFKSNIIII